VTVVAVSDTGPLIHLGEIHSLELLDAFDRLYVPETVYDELERGGVPDDLEKLSFDRLEPDELQPETTELDPGSSTRVVIGASNESVSNDMKPDCNWFMTPRYQDGYTGRSLGVRVSRPPTYVSQHNIGPCHTFIHDSDQIAV
jgi:hypothetical protein